MLRASTGWRLAWLACVLAAVFVCVTRFSVTTSIESFWLSDDDRRDGELMRALGGSALARTMIFAISHADPSVAAEVAADLADRLATHEEIERVRVGPEQGYEEAIYQLYFPRRFGFVASTPEGVEAALDDQSLRTRAQRLKAELARPTGAALKQVATRDPWLLFLERMRSLAALESGSVELRDGRFWANDHALVFATTHHSPTDLAHQEDLGRFIDELVAKLQDERGVSIERSAIHRVALDTKAAVEADIRRITTVSSLVLVVMLLVVWRSLFTTVVLFIPLVTGICGATAISLLLYGELHGLTLAFGATLIGVCLDYPVHWLVHRTVQGHVERHVVWGIVLGAGTTLAGFIGLALTPLPGIRQIGVFASIGVCLAVATTLCLSRALPRMPGGPERLHARAVLVERVLTFARRRALQVVVVAGASVLAFVGITRVQWVDDVHAFAELAPGALAEEERARDIAGRVDLGRVIVAWGEDDEEALQSNDFVAVELERRGIPYKSLHRAVWSQALQVANVERVRAMPDLAERTRAALEAAGFRAEAFAGLEQELATSASPLRPADLEDTILETMLDLFRVEIIQPQPATALLTYVGELPEDLVTQLQAREGVTVFEQKTFLGSIYRRTRTRTLPWLGAGMLLVIALLGARYRDPRRVLAAFLPACLAAPATVGILVLMGHPLHLLHLVGLLLVLSMSVDYGVFLVECPRAEEAGVTGLGVAIAWLSTILGFGLLAFSQVPALSAVGLVVAIGVTLGFILAPITWVLLERSPHVSSRPD